jgi:hypothetical protein
VIFAMAFGSTICAETKDCDENKFKYIVTGGNDKKVIFWKPFIFENLENKTWVRNIDNGLCGTFY